MSGKKTSAYIIGRNSCQNIKRGVCGYAKMHKLDKRKVFKTYKV